MRDDPTDHVALLHQCLAGDKKPIGFFLGAGCPLAVRIADGSGAARIPLIPDVNHLTDKVRRSIGCSSELRSPFKSVEEQLILDQDHRANIEDILTHIRTLAAVAGHGDVRGLTGSQLALLDEFICQVIHDVVDKELPDRETPYHNVSKWVNAVRRDYPVEFFTPNYDLLLERAMEETRTPYFDGFPGVLRPLFDAASVDDQSLPSHWARVWKIHGSINWYQKSSGEVFRSSASEEDQKRVIHPSHLKHQESRRMPYLALLDRLRNFLRLPTAALIFCGYSFRDEHINDTIAQGLQYTRTAIAYALLFGSLCEYPKAVELGKHHPNLNVMARDKGVVGGREVEWSRPVSGLANEPSGLAVRWVKLDEVLAADYERGEFLLGDFQVLAQLLSSLFRGSAQARKGGPYAS